MAIQVDEHQVDENGPGCVELLELSPNEWRISDRRIPAGDAGSVLGFAERVCEGRYEVLRLGHGSGIERLTFAGLDDVRSYFAEHVVR